MPAWLTWMLGIGCVTGESALLGALGMGVWSLQAGLVWCVVLGLRRDFIPGALTLAFLIPVVEWYAGGPKGVYGLGLALIFLLMQLIRPQLHREWGLMHLGAAVLAFVLQQLIVAAGMMFGPHAGPIGAAILWSLPVSIIGGLLALWPIAWMVDRGDAMFEGTMRRAMFD